ncbi:hypothetical protein BCR42DRAFT_405256 [Absidia repens]|uniref:Uncharacterized protein n=1 Tax=Absidia repens TaxID=90262 RepID=A0A1X2IT56_9FUNG|nr:hypothetical protein BCR42DRAFT_405256 [Absidia repens]
MAHKVQSKTYGADQPLPGFTWQPSVVRRMSMVLVYIFILLVTCTQSQDVANKQHYHQQNYMAPFLFLFLCIYPPSQFPSHCFVKRSPLS